MGSQRIQDRLLALCQAIDGEHAAEVATLRQQLQRAAQREQELIKRLAVLQALVDGTKNVTTEPKNADEKEASDPKNGFEMSLDLEVLLEIWQQRQRQIRKGHGYVSDDALDNESLVEAAIYYAAMGRQYSSCSIVDWPWEEGHPHWASERGQEQGHIHAAALLIAEVVRRRRGKR